MMPRAPQWTGRVNRKSRKWVKNIKKWGKSLKCMKFLFKCKIIVNYIIMAPRGGMSGPWRAHEQDHRMPGAKVNK